MAAEIWRTRDRAGRDVVLTEAHWAHIPGEHEDMARWLDDIATALQTPDFVNRDARHPNGENHYRCPTPDEPWTRVVVRYRPVPPQGTWVGEVITAHRTRRIGSEEEHLWP